MQRSFYSLMAQPWSLGQHDMDACKFRRDQMWLPRQTCSFPHAIAYGGEHEVPCWATPTYALEHRLPPPPSVCLYLHTLVRPQEKATPFCELSSTYPVFASFWLFSATKRPRFHRLMVVHFLAIFPRLILI